MLSSDILYLSSSSLSSSSSSSFSPSSSSSTSLPSSSDLSSGKASLPAFYALDFYESCLLLGFNGPKVYACACLPYVRFFLGSSYGPPTPYGFGGP